MGLNDAGHAQAQHKPATFRMLFGFHGVDLLHAKDDKREKHKRRKFPGSCPHIDV